jgi:hypothetical protein
VRNRNVEHFISGREVKGASVRTANVFEPMTGEVQAKVSLASKAELHDEVEDSKAAQRQWGNTNPKRRARVMMKFLELMQSEYDSLAELRKLLRAGPAICGQEAGATMSEKCSPSAFSAGLAFSAGFIAALSLVAFLAMPSYSFAAEPVATKATCGSNDHPETGLQGQTSLAERFAPGPARAYNCNLQLVGQHIGEGSAWGLAVTDKCAYIPQYQDPERPPVLKNPGVAVLDVTDSAKPRLVKYLTSPAMMNASESGIVDPRRKLYIAQNYTGSKDYPVNTTDIYDVSDCLHPVLKFSGVLPNSILHVGDFSPDGKTFWAGNCCFSVRGAPPQSINLFALDIADPSQPKILAQWEPEDKRWEAHAVSVSDDGNTAYMSLIGIKDPTRHGLVILDISEVQARSPQAKIKLISSLLWSDTNVGQFVFPLTIGGRKYAFYSDLGGAFTADYSQNRVEACRSGKPAWGYVHLIDVEDPKKPERVSGLRLEVHDPKNCTAVAHDPVAYFGYGSTTCDADNYRDAKLIVCGFFEGGLRVFDIRDVKHPREIAYYKPAAVWAQPRLATYIPTFLDSGPQTGPAKVHTADVVTFPFLAEGGKEIWFTSLDGGFQVVRFSDELMAREKALFPNTSCVGRSSRRGCSPGG